MSRIVCDTNCLISGLVWRRGPTGRIIARVQDGADTLFITHELMAEFVGVIQRPKFAAALLAASLTSRALVLELSLCVLFVDPYPLAERIVIADPDDDMVLACAATTLPAGIISGDQHLLQLKAFEGIPILSPREYIKETERSE